MCLNNKKIKKNSINKKKLKIKLRKIFIKIIKKELENILVTKTKKFSSTKIQKTQFNEPGKEFFNRTKK